MFFFLSKNTVIVQLGLLDFNSIPISFIWANFSSRSSSSS